MAAVTLVISKTGSIIGHCRSRFEGWQRGPCLMATSWARETFDVVMVRVDGVPQQAFLVRPGQDLSVLEQFALPPPLNPAWDRMYGMRVEDLQLPDWLKGGA